MLAGVVVTTQLGISAAVFYLAIYVVMNLAAFAVIMARERETGLGDDISLAVRARRATGPLLAWPMTIAMLALAGFPATAGLLRQALPDQRGRRQRLRVARRRDRARVGDLAGLLPAGGRGRLDARAVGGARAACVRGSPGDRRRVRRRPTRRPAPQAASPVPTSTVLESDFDTSEPVRRTLRQPEVVFVAVVVRAGDDRARHLPRAAVRRRQGRRRARFSRCSSRQGGEFSRAPPMRGVRSHPTAGQATLEYIAAVALVAALLLVAAPAVGAPDIARAVADAIKHGLCVAGGDVCSTGDARRAGLPPCPLKSDFTGAEGSVKAFSVELGREVDADRDAALGRVGGDRPRGRRQRRGLRAVAGPSGSLGPMQFAGRCGRRAQGAGGGRARLGAAGRRDRQALPRALARALLRRRGVAAGVAFGRARRRDLGLARRVGG